MRQVQCFFTTQGNSGVTPPFIEGQPTSMWVSMPDSKKDPPKKEIIAACERKLMACYGQTIIEWRGCNIL